MGNLCQACMAELKLSTSPIPLCKTCYDELLALPIDQRMARIADLRKNELLSEFLDRFIDALEASAQRNSFRGN